MYPSIHKIYFKKQGPPVLSIAYYTTFLKSIYGAVQFLARMSSKQEPRLLLL